jgi:hypothetical protein
MPASAQNASAVASEHTTFATGSQGEPSPAQLAGLSIEGSGEGASVVATEQSTASSGTDDNTFATSSKSGLRINPNTDLTALRATVSADTSATTAYLTDASLSVLESTPIPGDKEVSFSTELSAGTTYYVLVDDNGAEYTTGYHVYTSATYPITSETVDITATRFNGGDRDGDSANRYGVRSVTGVEQTGNGTYVGAAHDAEDIATGWANLTLQNAEADVTWQEDGDGDGSWSNVTSTTATTTTNVTQDLSTTTSDRWRVRVDFSATGSNPVAQIHDEGVLFEPASPTLSNPEPPDEVKIANAVGNVSINVSDADFPLAQGDSVSVSATDGDGTSLGSTTLTSNGTASFSYSSDAGENTINWQATDSYGNSESYTQTFTTPSTLTLYNETSPNQKISTNSEITATFFGSDGETVIERTSSDATFDFSGLPADTEYIVTVDAEGYRERTLIIRNLYKQQSFYLLSQNTSASQIVFELSDPTGEFPPRETRLYVEKPLTVNNSTTYRTVAADTFGATSAYSVTLADGARYRLRVRHDGQERILGSYTVTVPTTEPLQVQRIEPSADEVPQGSVYGGVEDGQLAVRFRGGDADTAVTYRVTAENETVVVPETEVIGASFAHVYPVNNSTAQSYNVSYEIAYGDGTVQTGSFQAGGVAGIAGRFAIDPQLLSLLSWATIMAAMGLVVIVDTRLAPAVGTGTASALTIIGTVAIPAALLGVAGAISVLTLVGRPS